MQGLDRLTGRKPVRGSKTLKHFNIVVVEPFISQDYYLFMIWEIPYCIYSSLIYKDKILLKEEMPFGSFSKSKYSNG
jgi:hypothetical protein